MKILSKVRNLRVSCKRVYFVLLSKDINYTVGFSYLLGENIKFNTVICLIFKSPAMKKTVLFSFRICREIVLVAFSKHLLTHIALS